MKDKQILGRKEELKVLGRIWRSKEAEFLAIYGRRRVGKTFLIREFFKKKGIYLETTGVKKLSLMGQLQNFSEALSKTFFNGGLLQVPKSWNEAFELLTKQVEGLAKGKKMIIFLDELPWLASPKSGLLPALDYYWNVRWSQMSNLILIVCGSAASWMLTHIVHARGGLYNRLTRRLFLEPFNLKETQEYLKNRNIHFKPKQILDLYMVLGGIPHYLKEIEKGESVSHIIDRLCFHKNGLLYTEFSNLFNSLFDHADIHLDIVRAIARAGNTVSRDKLIQMTSLSSGGTLNKRLEELEASGFIRSFVPFGKKKRDRFYRLVDEYANFYLKWIEPLVLNGAYSGRGGYWQKICKTPAKSTWCGYAFEGVCYKHINQIAHALDLGNISFICGSWKYIPPKKSVEIGTQVDLLFDQYDDTITLCEIKYSEKPFEINKGYAKDLDRRIEIFEQNFPIKRSPTKKQVMLAMITTHGIKRNMYSMDLIHNEVVIEDLFKI